MENNQMLKPTLPKEKRTSPRSQMLASASSKRSPRVPALPSSPSALDDKTPDKNDSLVPSPLQYNRRSGLSARGQPSIVRPKFDSNSPSTSRNQKKPRDKASARTPRCESILDVKTHPRCQKYVSDIERIERIKKKLTTRHAENERYYNSHYTSFLRILKEAINENPAKIPIVVQNTKMFFEGLLQNLIGKRGKLDKANFDFEGTLRSILSSADSTINDQNGFKELFENGKLSIDLSKLKQYESEIEEIKGLMQKLVDRHPENERYYRKHYESFLRILSEAVSSNSQKAPTVIRNTKMFFEGLLNGLLGKNGRLKTKSFNFEEKLRKVISNEDDDTNDDIIQELIDEEAKNKDNDEDEQDKLQKFMSDIKEINNIVQQLIDKYPENEDYYRDLYDSFMKVLNEAIKTDDEKAPSIIQNARTFFEGLLNDQIGENGKIDDPEFNFEERLRKILSKEDDDDDEDEDDDENVFEDLINKKEKEKLQKYEAELKKINDLVEQLIDKHPENEDYYRDLYDSFMNVLKEAINTDDEKAPSIIQNARTFFEGLLNDQIGENGKIDDPEFNFEERLRKLLSQENNEEEDDNENVFKDLLNKKEQEKLQKYETEIKEINDLVQQLVDKHPENEDYYRDLYDSFMKILKEAINTDDEKAPSIIQNAKTFFEGLLNDQIGENGKVDDSEFNFEERLRKLLSQENNEEEENENVFKDLLNKKEQTNLQKYETELKEINDLLQQLIDKNPENEDYYRKRYDAFMRVLSIADSEEAPKIIKETKEIFQDLLKDEESEKEHKQQDATSQVLEEEEEDIGGPDLNFTSSGRYNLPALAEDPEYDDDEEKKNKSQSILQTVDNENGSADDDSQGGTTADKKDDESNQSVLDKYQSEIGEIKNLMNDLIEKHPENEDYYRKLYDAFMRVIKEASEADSPAAPEIIEATKSIFEDLLNGEQDRLDYDLEDRLREILSKSNERENKDEINENVEEKDDSENNNNDNNEDSEENDQSSLKKYESEIGEIKNLMNDLIEKHPENEDYYKKLYEAFMKVIKEASEADSPAAPEIIEATKSIFEDLLNGEQDRLDYELEDKLREILSKSNEKENEKSEENDQSNLVKYESEIGEIQNLMNELIEQHPENEDYYRKLYDAFMKVIKEASEADSPAAPEIIEATKSIFEDLLNGEQGRLDYELEDKLREILSKSNEIENENEPLDANKTESAIDEITSLLHRLIEKHPENEEFYQKLYDSFIVIIRQASEANSPQVSGIIRATKLFFEELLNGEHAKIDFNIGEKLREILLSVNNIPNENKNESENNENNENENNENEIDNLDENVDLSNYEGEIGEIENLMQDLIDKHPENEDYYRKLYEAFMKVVKEAAEANSPAAVEIIKAAKKIFADLYNGEQDHLDFDMEDKLREILSIYKPYNEVDDEDEDMKMSQTSSSRNPRFEKLYPPPQVTSDNKHRTSTVPNYQTILCALRFSCLPGPRFTKLVESIATTMKENKDERYVLLMASRTHKFKGIYILSDDELSAKKMWGEGPKQIKSEDCGAFSKYITNQKIFEPLQIKSFTQTTDAFSLKKNAEPDLW